MDQDRPAAKASKVSRKTIRLTFRASKDDLELLSVERLEMITPPQPGEMPRAGTHGGWWFELRDSGGRALAHRVVDPSLLNSVEVHSPDGSIERKFGSAKTGVFEVLLPDVDDARSAVLVGTPLRGSRRRATDKISGDIASFDLSPNREGGKR